MSYLILVLGVALWSGVHLFKRIAPDARARLGDKAKAPIAILLVLSIVLMWWGYGNSNATFWWGRHPATVGINNLLMLLAIYLFAVSGAKTVLGQKMRHPQLAAVKTWALAHLLVNGDLASLILFGGLLAWAVVEVILINRQTEWTKPQEAVVVPRKEVTAIVATVVVYAVVSGLHYLAGYPVFG